MPALSIAIVGTTHQDNPDHAAAHVALHKLYNGSVGSSPESGPGTIGSAPFSPYYTKGKVLDIILGSDVDPVTTDGPSMRMTRVEDYDDDSGVASNFGIGILNMHLKSLATNQSQAVAMTVAVEQYSTATGFATSGGGKSDAVAIQGLVVQRAGAKGSAIGGYFSVQVDSTEALAGGQCLQMGIINNSGINKVYNPNGFTPFSGIWLPALSLGNGHVKAGVGIELGTDYTGSGNGAQFDVGYAASINSIFSSMLRDDSNASISLDIRGSHFIGLDTTNSAFTGYVAKLISAVDTQLYIGGSGANYASIIIDAQLAGKQSIHFFQDAGVNKWQVGRFIDNSYIAYDNANSIFQLQIQPGIPGANKTGLYLSEGTGPTQRQVRWKDGASIIAGDKVMVLV